MSLERITKLFIIFSIIITIEGISYLVQKRGGANSDNHFCVSTAESKVDVFDFRKLNKDEDYIVRHDDVEYRLQLCKELVHKCNGKNGYNICMKVKDKEIGFGKLPPERVINERGRHHFVFIGDQYNNTDNYTTNVMMSCDFSSPEISLAPEIFPLVQNGKDLVVFWKTRAACTEEFQTNCSVSDKSGNHYDLNPLKKYSDNYKIQISENAAIILNICHSIIYGPDSVCNRKAGVCWQDSTDQQKPKYINLGSIEPNKTAPIVQNNTLQLVYEDGNMCRISGISGEIKSTITFVCDFTQTESEPEYIGGREMCHYKFLWKTAAACDIESLKSHSLQTADQCTVMNPLTNFKYDLRILKYHDLHPVSTNNTKFDLKICAPLMKDYCTNNSGICNKDTKVSYGKVNTKLLWEQGGPYLNYTDGDLCDNGQPRYTKIGFFCGPENTESNYPIMMEVENCFVIMHWSTKLVCEQKKIQCITEEHNLKHMIQSINNYVVKVNNTEFHINVCRPLIAKPDLTCAHGSAVCKATRNTDGKLIEETSLGYVVDDLYVDGSDTILLYQNGSICPENSKIRLASKIIFTCHHKAGKGEPQLKRYSDCTYTFEWKTRYVCPSVSSKFNDDYTINIQDFHAIDLSPVKNKVFTVKNERGESYDLCIFNCNSRCHSSVCKGDMSYGNVSNVLLKYDEDIIILKTENGGKCNSTHIYIAEIRMICKEAAGIGEPKFIWDKQCFVEFNWETNVTCISGMKMVNQTTENFSKDTYKPSVINLILAVILLVIVVVIAIIYCRNSSQRMVWLNFCAKPCSTRKVNDSVKYSRVNTTEEARLLLDGPDTALACQTDSSDDELLDF